MFTFNCTALIALNKINRSPLWHSDYIFSPTPGVYVSQFCESHTLINELFPLLCAVVINPTVIASVQSLSGFYFPHRIENKPIVVHVAAQPSQMAELSFEPSFSSMFYCCVFCVLNQSILPCNALNSRGAKFGSKPLWFCMLHSTIPAALLLV